VYLQVIFSGLFFVLLGSSLLLGLVRRVSDWSSRRTLQFAVLMMPLVILALDFCSLGLSSGESFAGGTLFLAMSVIALGALVLGGVRLVLIARFVTRHALFTQPELPVLAHLARQLGVSAPSVRVSPTDRPLALTCGLRKPTILLSTWIVEHLDRRELEAVLTHELEHVARRDYLMIWLATMLRDAFFYLPTSWIAYRQLQQEKELACDDLASGVTQRPLALASALAKVWLHVVEGPDEQRLAGAQALTGAQASINGRIERLLAPSASSRRKPHAHRVAFSLNMVVLPPLGVFQVACLFLLLMSAWGGCHPVALFGRLC